MSSMTQVGSTVAAAVNAVASQGTAAVGNGNARKTDKNENSVLVEKSAAADEEKKTGKVTGRVVGNPKLSEKAAKYYEELKRKYGNLDFVLVSADQKANAQANAGSFANANRMVVLIDEEKIERMAEDENYRKQYEGIISNAASGLSQLAKNLENTPGVKSYGAKINDGGTASFFAVIDKSLASQKERIAKNAAKKKEAKKAEEKKAAKEERQEKLEKSRAERTRGDKVYGDSREEDLVTVTASSVQELMDKINDVYMAGRSDMVETDAEKQVGRNFDFSL